AGLKLPPRRKQHVPASDTKSADSYLRSRTIPIAAPPCPPSRAFVQSGFNEGASEPSAAPSRLRDLTEPSRFPNRSVSDSPCGLGRRPAWMGKPYSLDLRKRVVAAIEGGMSPNQAPKQIGGAER